MFTSMKASLRGLTCVGLMGLGVAGAGCTSPNGEPGTTPEPKRLADVVVTDPNFDFSTTQSVRLQLQVAEGAQPQAVEAFDADGRRLMDGAFKAGASIDLRVPVGRADKVKLRIGTGATAEERELTVGADGTATGNL